MVGAIDLAASLKRRGRRALGYLRVGETNDGSPLTIPVAVVSGRVGGPVVWINGSIHGDEYLGPVTMARLIRGLTPEGVRGSLILTPVLNPLAFRAFRRTNPVDDVDMNRIWAAPGLPFATAQLRDIVSGEVLERADAVVDLHSGGNRFLQSAFTVYPALGGSTEKSSRAMALAAGIPLVWAHKGSILEGGLVTAVARMGKPALLVEVAGEGKVEEAWVGTMALAVQGVLGNLGVLPFSPALLPSYHIFTGFHTVTSHRGGLFRRLVEPGVPMKKGQQLGEVYDPFGRSLEVLRSPAGPGYVLGICTYGAVAAGDYVAELGTEAREHRTVV